MTNNDFQKKLILQLEDHLRIKIQDTQTPLQGMDSTVFFIRDVNNQEYAIKYSEGSIVDTIAFKLLKDNGIDILVPKLFNSFQFEGKTVLILEKINYPLLESLSVDQMYRYIPSMVKSLKKIHQVKSVDAGSLTKINQNLNWKKVMLSKFTGSSNHNWSKIARRKGLETALILKSVEYIVKRIAETKFIDNAYSFLHTDFNQRNLFIDPKSDKIVSIIDWSESMFGDPIYDFARVRMFIWHFNLPESVLEDYHKLLTYTSEEKELENLYWLSMIIEYLVYYSEELSEFNKGRIKLHQDFLRTGAFLM